MTIDPRFRQTYIVISVAPECEDSVALAGKSYLWTGGNSVDLNAGRTACARIGGDVFKFENEFEYRIMRLATGSNNKQLTSITILDT